MIWQIEMLKQGIPDPSVAAQWSENSGDKDRSGSLQDEQLENFADAVFVHTKFAFNSLFAYTQISNHFFFCYQLSLPKMFL